MSETLRILALVEASTVTGPVKNLLDFCVTARDLNLGVETIIAAYQRDLADNDLLRGARARDIPVRVIPERAAFDRSVIGKVRALCEEISPDILQTHAVKSHFLVRLSGLWRTHPWVAFHHGYTTTNLKMRTYNELDRWSLRKPDRLVTVSRAFEAQLVARGMAHSRITVLQNAVDPAWIAHVKSLDKRAVRREMGISDEDEVILAAGRLSHEKAHIDLVSALKLLRLRRPRARLILVGEGPERSALESAAAGDPVLFTGQVPAVAAYYAAADVMALPSLSEGSPNVLLEAMACGVPSVATSTGGTPEIVTSEESALLVPARDPQRLAEALERLLADKALARRLAARAADIIAERHTPQARARELLTVYRHLARGGERRLRQK